MTTSPLPLAQSFTLQDFKDAGGSRKGFRMINQEGFHLAGMQVVRLLNGKQTSKFAVSVGYYQGMPAWAFIDGTRVCYCKFVLQLYELKEKSDIELIFPFNVANKERHMLALLHYYSLKPWTQCSKRPLLLMVQGVSETLQHLREVCDIVRDSASAD